MSREDKSERNDYKSATIVIITTVVLVVLCLSILANSMTKPVGRDEHMYCTGAVLLAQGKMIYRDFSYAAQMPCHPLLYAILFRAFSTTRYLLVGRLSSCVCDILILICIVGVYRLIFKPFIIAGTLMGLMGAVLYIFNPLVDYANGYAWNHDIVILCVVLSLFLFLSVDFRQKSKYRRIAAIGALLTLATCMRVTTALVELLFFVMLLSMPMESIKQRFKTTLPFLSAAALIIIWPVCVIAHAPRAFYLNLIKIPTLYGRWLHEVGMVFDKLQLTTASLTTPGYLVLIGLLIYLYLTIIYLRRRLEIPDIPKLILTAMLAVVFFIIALIPPTMWMQYLAAPVPFLIISLAFPLSYLRKFTQKVNVHNHFKTASVLLVVCVLVAVLSYPVVLYRIPLACSPQIWTPNKLHETSEDIVNVMGEPELTLTLSPLFALEGGCEIYTELSCGAIIYRIADSLTPEERRITHTVGMKTLVKLLGEKPPAAIITGMEMESLEKSLLEAAGPEWLRKDYPNGPTLHYRHSHQ